MSLTSLNFFLFLSASLAVYFRLSEKYQWRWLLAVSCFFLHILQQGSVGIHCDYLHFNLYIKYLDRKIGA